MNLKDMIAVLQAAEAGKPIQQQLIPGMAGPPWPEWAAWRNEWDFLRYRYRVKPEPREWWASIDGCGHPETLYTSYDTAEGASRGNGKPIKVREVLE